MKFITDIKQKDYENFITNSKKSHFLQSYKWGVFAASEKNLIPHYVGLENEKQELVAVSLLLEKKLPLGYSYFYAPRGYIINFEDLDLLRAFTNEIKSYAKRNKAIFVKIDPDIIYNKQDHNGNTLIEKNDKALNNLLTLGYTHLGFTKGFETSQPRYTFRIDFTKSTNFDEVKNNFSKTTLQRIKKAEDLFVEIKIGDIDSLDEFYNLMTITEKKKDIVNQDKKYYETLYKIWSENDKCKLFLGLVDITKIKNSIKNTLTDLNEELSSFPKELSNAQKQRVEQLETRITKLKEDLAKYIEVFTHHDSPLVVSAYFILEYNDTAWVLYAGNHNVLQEVCTNYKIYEEHMKYYYNKGIKTYDLFGTVGETEDTSLLGIHEFKKKFGGDYIEFIGEFDLIINKPMYFVFKKLIPIYRNKIRNKTKRSR